MIENYNPDRRSAAFVAHPGHELRLHGWLSRAKPVCMILTTGSRSGTDRNRLQASARIVESAGGQCSRLFGAVLDRDLYGMILAGDATPFRKWTEKLADILVTSRTEQLVVDGWQLYSVSHDLTHIIGRLAAERASRALGYKVEVLQYEVVPALLAECSDSGKPAFELNLSDDELKAKLAAIDSYPGIEFELIEIRQIEEEGHARTERFFVPPPIADVIRPPSTKPKYESYGEARLADGIYQDVIRWHHVEKIIHHLVASQRAIP